MVVGKAHGENTREGEKQQNAHAHTHTRLSSLVSLSLEFHYLLYWVLGVLGALITAPRLDGEDSVQAPDDDERCPAGSHPGSHPTGLPTGPRRIVVRRFIGCQALVLARAMAATNHRGLDGALKGLTSTPDATELCESTPETARLSPRARKSRRLWAQLGRRWL